MVDISKLAVTLTVDWSAGPFYIYSGQEGISGVCDVEDLAEILPLSAELLSEIAAWNESFQDTYDTNDPASSGFKTEEEERRFNDAGRELARRIRAEAPESVKVYYSPIWDYETEEITG